MARGNATPEEAEREAEACVLRLRALLTEGACYTLSQLRVNGRDLGEAGFRGPEVGRALNELLLRVVRGELPNEKEALLRAVRNETRGKRGGRSE